MFKVKFQKNNFDQRNFADNSYGLLVGKSYPSIIDVFVALECPEENKDDEDIEDANKINKTLFEQINSNWISQHAFNTLRMLPGGVEIVGFYFVDSNGAAKVNSKQTQYKLEKIMREIHQKELDACYNLFSHDSNKIYLHLDSGGSINKSCKVLKLGKDNSESFSNCECSCSDDVLSRYDNYQSVISMKIDAIMPTERNKEKILKQLKDAVNPFVDELVRHSTMLVNHQIVDHPSTVQLSQLRGLVDARDSPGDIAAGDSRTTSSDVECKDIELVFIGVEMGLESSPSNNESSSDIGLDVINRLKIQGRIPGFAFLNKQATVLDVEQALKRDLTKSLFTRLELLAEELHITGGEIEVSQMLLPQRVLLNLPGCRSLPISDYKFLSETPEDVITRIRYFSRPAGLCEDDIGISCINQSVSGLETSEQTSLEDDLSEVEAVELEKELANPTMSQTHGMIIFVGLSTLVFVLSLLSYYLLN